MVATRFPHIPALFSPAGGLAPPGSPSAVLQLSCVIHCYFPSAFDVVGSFLCSGVSSPHPCTVNSTSTSEILGTVLRETRHGRRGRVVLLPLGQVRFHTASSEGRGCDGDYLSIVRIFAGPSLCTECKRFPPCLCENLVGVSEGKIHGCDAPTGGDPPGVFNTQESTHSLWKTTQAIY